MKTEVSIKCASCDTREGLKWWPERKTGCFATTKTEEEKRLNVSWPTTGTMADDSTWYCPACRALLASGINVLCACDLCDVTVRFPIDALATRQRPWGYCQKCWGNRQPLSPEARRCDKCRDRTLHYYTFLSIQGYGGTVTSLTTTCSRCGQVESKLAICVSHQHNEEGE